MYQALARERDLRGAIDFESVETKMEFDARGKILRIVPEPRNEAHRLIEECMLAANVCAGNFLSSRAHPVLYRVHDVPAPEKVTALRDSPNSAMPSATSPSRRTTRSCWRRSGRVPTIRCCRPSCCAR